MNTKGNNRFAMENYKRGIKNRKLWIILILANLCSIPYGIFTAMMFPNYSIYNYALTGFALVVNVIMGMVIPFLQFDYCYDKTKVDMAYALPMTRKQRFFSDFFSGLTIYVGAYVIQIIASYIMAILFLIKGGDLPLDVLYQNRYKMAGTPWFIYNLTKILVIILLMQILLYVVTTFVIACTGALFEAISATVYTNILIPTTIFVCYELIKYQVYGIRIEDAAETVIYKTSPLGGFLYLVDYGSSELPLWKWTLPYSAIILIVTLVTYYIMKHRSAEAVGKPFVIRSFYHVVLVAVVLHIGVLACHTENSLLTFITLTLGSYMIIDTITNRGFKKWKQSFLRYGVTIGGVLLVLLTMNWTNCFGLANRVANENQVEKIQIEYDGLFETFRGEMFEVTSKEMIHKVLEVQNKVIKTYQQERKKLGGKALFDWNVEENHTTYDPSWDAMNRFLHIKVEMKHGFDYDREYYISYDDILELVDLELSQEVIKGRIEQVRNRNYIWSFAVSDKYHIEEKSIERSEDKKFEELVNEFLDCLQEDLLEISKEEYLRPKEPTEVIVNVNWFRIPVLKSYKRTIEFLMNHHLVPEVSDEDYERMIQTGTMYLHDMKDGLKMSQYCTTFYNDDDGIDGIYRVEELDNALLQLLKKAQPQYASESACDKIIVNGDMYIIPPEDSDEFQRILQEGVESGKLFKEEYGE